MKKITREILWVCLPLFIVGGGVVIDKALHPPADPDAKIHLMVKQKQPLNQGQNSVWLGWKADVSDGPTLNFLPVYNQTIWAVGEGWKTQLFADPAHKGMPMPEISGGGGWSPRGWNSAQRLTTEQEIRVPAAEIPLGTQKLEWQGQFAVAPNQERADWHSAARAKVKQVAQMPNAAQQNLAFSVALNPEQIIPIYDLKVRPVPGTKNQKVDVTYALRDQDHAVCQTLTAFDGTKTRSLWNGQVSAAKPNAYWDGKNDSAIYEEKVVIYTFRFDLSRVPPNEKVVFKIDAAYATKNSAKSAGETEQNVSFSALENLEKQGWFRASSQIVVRSQL